MNISSAAVIDGACTLGASRSRRSPASRTACAVVEPKVPILISFCNLFFSSLISSSFFRYSGSVEIINKQVSKVASDVKNKANDFADMVKNKVNEMKKDTNKDNSDSKQKVYTGSDTVYSYTVNFDDEKEKDNSEN